MNLIDLTSKAPTEYRVRVREPEAVTSVTLHSTGFSGWSSGNPNWAKIRAHYCVRQDGSVLLLHDPLVRMSVGSGRANRYTVSVECEQNPANDRGNFFKPERFGRDDMREHPAQVAAALDLLRHLAARFPSIRTIATHRSIDGARRPNCPGPTAWALIAVPAMAELGWSEAVPLAGGLPTPATWRGL